MAGMVPPRDSNASLPPNGQGPPSDRLPHIDPPADGGGYEVSPPAHNAPTTISRGADRHLTDRAAPPRRVLFNEEQQFTLGGLLLLMTLVGLLLGPVAWLPLPVFAGMLGLGALILLALISVFQAHLAIVKLAWWLMLALYASAAAAAFIFS